ncbi:MAG: hypothetical protein WB626_02915 [Bacteroidota bacterium]
MERFILKDAPIAGLRRVMRAASAGGPSSHPLSGAAFRRIVQAALRERNRRLARFTRALRRTPRDPLRGPHTTGRSRPR